jgi:hypothetical protein
MSVAYINELERILIRESKNTDQTLYILKELLEKLQREIEQAEQIIYQIGPRLIASKGVVEKIQLIQLQDIYLEDEDCQQDYKILMRYLNNIIESNNFYNNSGSGIHVKRIELDEIEGIMHILDTFRFVEMLLLRGIKKEGYVKEYESLQGVRRIAIEDREIKWLLKAMNLYEQMTELETDLEREKRKHEVLEGREEQRILMTQLQEQKDEYRKDITLLIEGLLETEGNYYTKLRPQLDEVYRRMIQEKLVKLNKLVNLQEKFVLDEERLRTMMSGFTKELLKIRKHIRTTED